MKLKRSKKREYLCLLEHFSRFLYVVGAYERHLLLLGSDLFNISYPSTGNKISWNKISVKVIIKMEECWKVGYYYGNNEQIVVFPLECALYKPNLHVILLGVYLYLLGYSLQFWDLPCVNLSHVVMQVMKSTEWSRGSYKTAAFHIRYENFYIWGWDRFEYIRYLPIRTLD